MSPLRPQELHELLLENLIQKCGVCRGQAGILGVSGGSDSLALMLSMSAVKDALALRLRVVTIDHGLRPDARREIEHVRNLCVRFGLPFTAVEVDTRRRASLDGVGIEEAARI